HAGPRIPRDAPARRYEAARAPRRGRRRRGGGDRRLRAGGSPPLPGAAHRGRRRRHARPVLGARRPRGRVAPCTCRGRVRCGVGGPRLPRGAQRTVAGVPVLDGRRVVSAPLAALPDEELTLLDLADRLLNRGVVITGEATISVAGVDLVYLGLNLILAAVETIEQRDARRK